MCLHSTMSSVVTFFVASTFAYNYWFKFNITREKCWIWLLYQAALLLLLLLKLAQLSGNSSNDASFVILIHIFHWQALEATTTRKIKYISTQIFYPSEMLNFYCRRGKFDSRNHHHKLNTVYHAFYNIAKNFMLWYKDVNEKMTQFYRRFSFAEIHKIEIIIILNNWTNAYRNYSAETNNGRRSSKEAIKCEVDFMAASNMFGLLERK